MDKLCLKHCLESILGRKVNLPVRKDGYIDIVTLLSYLGYYAYDFRYSLLAREDTEGNCIFEDEFNLTVNSETNTGILMYERKEDGHAVVLDRAICSNPVGLEDPNNNGGVLEVQWLRMPRKKFLATEQRDLCYFLKIWK